MRLLSAHSLTLRSFEDERKAPPYAILSHTWGDDEISIDDIGGPRFLNDVDSQGVSKILKCAEQARKEGLDWIWVDTCCIQKSSSAELSEAINSMFRWYKQSAVCYAYLNDVSPRPRDLPNLNYDFTKEVEWQQKFAASRWFTRGWTLQELIAPQNLTFFSSDWQHIGTKEELEKVLFDITKITRDSLLFGDTFGESMARRMSWAANRQTTRVEDMAYCLLGIFNINMPLLYGEGERAFQRLQEEIIKVTDDETIFAWTAKTDTYATWRSLFANSPAEFEDSGNYFPLTEIHNPHSHTITNKGLQIRFPLMESRSEEKEWSSGTEFIAVLKCHYAKRYRPLEKSYTGILVKKIMNDEFVRVDPGRLFPVEIFSYPSQQDDKFTSIAVRQMLDYSPYYHLYKCFRISGIQIKLASDKIRFTAVQPQARWNRDKMLFSFDEESIRLGQRQVMTGVVRDLKDASAAFEITFDPQEIYQGSCCSYRLVKGWRIATAESLVRVTDGEAFLVVIFKQVRRMVYQKKGPKGWISENRWGRT